MDEVMRYGAQKGVRKNTHTVLKKIGKSLVWDIERAGKRVRRQRKGV